MLLDLEARMKRLAALGSMLSTLLLAGCLGEGTYTQRVDGYVEELRSVAKRDTYLKGPEGGDFSQLGIGIRLPKSMNGVGPFLQVAPGAFDLAQFYQDGGTSGVQMAVLARLKNPPPPPEGQAPAPRDGTAFPVAVAALLGQATPPATENSPQGGVPYKRYVLNVEESNPNPLIQVYLFDKGNHDVAVIAIIPKAVANAQLAKTELPLSLGSLVITGS
jgi:hypothetical protein